MDNVEIINLKDLIEYLNSFKEFDYYKCTVTERIIYFGIPLELAQRYGITKEELEKLQKSNPLNLSLGWMTKLAPNQVFSIFNLVDKC